MTWPGQHPKEARQMALMVGVRKQRKQGENEMMTSLLEVLRQAVGGYEELTNDRVTTATGIRKLWG